VNADYRVFTFQLQSSINRVSCASSLE